MVALHPLTHLSVSPSVYVAYYGIHATNDCSQTLGSTTTNMTLSFPPEDMTTYSPCGTLPNCDMTYPTINYATLWSNCTTKYSRIDDPSCETSASYFNAHPSLIPEVAACSAQQDIVEDERRYTEEHCYPQLDWPPMSSLQALNTAWKSCNLAAVDSSIFGVFDPPQTLGPRLAMVAPTKAPVFPSTSGAAPASQAVTQQPHKTASPSRSQADSDPKDNSQGGAADPPATGVILPTRTTSSALDPQLGMSLESSSSAQLRRSTIDPSLKSPMARDPSFFGPYVPNSPVSPAPIALLSSRQGPFVLGKTSENSPVTISEAADYTLVRTHSLDASIGPVPASPLTDSQIPLDRSTVGLPSQPLMFQDPVVALTLDSHSSTLTTLEVALIAGEPSKPLNLANLVGITAQPAAGPLISNTITFMPVQPGARASAKPVIVSGITYAPVQHASSAADPVAMGGNTDMSSGVADSNPGKLSAVLGSNGSDEIPSGGTAQSHTVPGSEDPAAWQSDVTSKILAWQKTTSIAGNIVPALSYQAINNDTPAQSQRSSFAGQSNFASSDDSIAPIVLDGITYTPVTATSAAQLAFSPPGSTASKSAVSEDIAAGENTSGSAVFGSTAFETIVSEISTSASANVAQTSSTEPSTTGLATPAEGIPGGAARMISTGRRFISVVVAIVASIWFMYL